MPWGSANHDALLDAALEEARAQAVYMIGRLQASRAWSIIAQNGELERVGAGRTTGLGVQVFTASGHCGFASSDLVEPSEARQLVRRAASLARAAAQAGGEPSFAVFELHREEIDVWPSSAQSADTVKQSERREVVLQLHRRARELANGFATATSMLRVDEDWRVIRSDGTDVKFRLPRSAVRHSFTSRGANRSASASCSVNGADDRVLLDVGSQERLEARARQAIRRARDVANAAPVRTGNYRIVLDHSMAKGLAHEAFGHAAETDGARGSVLASNGRLRLGERVASPGLSIVDGPVEGDFAYQPISSNGQPRPTVEIIRDGVLNSGLGDIFSAGQAGSPVTAAERASTFRSRPLPRMTNIRLVLADFSPLDRAPELLTPHDVRERLLDCRLIADLTPTLLLEGHRGGQVSPELGDFVFNCAAIYDLTNGVVPHQPALFSGKSLSALGSVVGALGDLLLDAPGNCVKSGQGVPTSGGSHAFVVLEPHPEVTVGGG